MHHILWDADVSVCASHFCIIHFFSLIVVINSLPFKMCCFQLCPKTLVSGIAGRYGHKNGPDIT